MAISKRFSVRRCQVALGRWEKGVHNEIYLRHIVRTYRGKRNPKSRSTGEKLV